MWASRHSYVTQTSLFCIFFSFRGVVDSLQINEWSLMFTTAFLFRNHLTMKYSVHHPDQSTNTSFEYCLILYLKTVVKLANRLLLIKNNKLSSVWIINSWQLSEQKAKCSTTSCERPTPICYSLVINNYKVCLGLLALHFLFNIYIEMCE